MADPDTGEISWYEPKNRGVIFLDQANIPKTVQKEMNLGEYQISINKDFRGTVKACAEREETWISDEIIDVYDSIYDMGYGYSFEVWDHKKLIGGLYGVAMGKVFFGESMFHKVTNASKIALAHCITTLRENNFHIIDTQYYTEHLKQFNTQEIPQQVYMKELTFALS
jgi:leucyl/phenylalanyl-tRNA--protein transferase